jgi:hypothetical protein
LASESEWTQHKKLIDFSKRPGGFRRSMVPNLPYFAVQWDYKGESFEVISEGLACLCELESDDGPAPVDFR